MLIARRAAGPSGDEGATVPRRAYFVAPAIAAFSLLVTLLWGARYDMGLRDPDGVVGVRLLFVFALVGAFWALDVVPRGVRRARAAERPLYACVREVAGERWSWRRVGIVLGTIVAFYITYLCYRNVKSYLPLARPELFDSELLEFEQSLLGEHPAVVLHKLLGTGIATHVLSTVYLLFLTFVPLSVGLALVWSSNLAGGLWWVAALSLNWVLGAASYFLLPSMGPVFVFPDLFGALPQTGASELQALLLEDRRAFLANPDAGGLQSIAAFASLHVSIVLTGALMARLLGAPRFLQRALWSFFAVTTVATVYLGWHYVVDDVAGVAIAVLAIAGAARLTGWRIERSPSRALVPVGQTPLK